ncbi:CCA-adding enzyme [Polynucleobacter sp. SHI8]|nr:CCA-adding enzyme [Polynucleobacter sp. SHI2]BDW14656.1 CCA-adding enzyme [Polynucleobacter sp. SHI8]
MRIYIVGGFLRDQLLGVTPKDKDYVVVGSTPVEMQAKGFIPIGQDFPVFLHPKTKEEYALARTERKTGQGYKGFTFYASAEVTLEQDLLRRDFTINAMAQEINLEGEMIGPLIDPCGGQKDLEQRVIRHVSKAFNEDPLRILRLARFMARLVEFDIDPNTLSLVQQMVKDGELKYLVPERVWQELSRGLIETKPSRMLDVLIQTGASKDVLPNGLEDAQKIHLTKEYVNLGIQHTADLQIQLAYFLSQVEMHELEQWITHWKIPTELRNFSLAFHHFYQILQKPTCRAEEVLQLFNSVDAWRKPDRLNKILNAMSQLGLKIEKWQIALKAALSVDAGLIAKNLQTNDGSVIQTVVAGSRLQAIAACW